MVKRSARKVARRDASVTSSSVAQAAQCPPVNPTGSTSEPNPQGPAKKHYEIVNAFWQGSNVVLVQRHNDVVSRRQVPAEYTCFFKAEDLDKENEQRLRQWREVRSIRREGSWWRVRFRDWRVIRAACATVAQHQYLLSQHREGRGEKPSPYYAAFERAGLVPYEADVHPVRRFLTDNDVHIQRPKRCYIDFEADQRQPIVRQVEGKARIVSWALVDEEGTKVYGLLEADEDAAEARLLSDLWDELLAYDQVCAWNGDRYDFPMFKARSEAMGLKVEPRRWLWLDHLECYRRYNMNVSESGEEKESMALDRVAQAVLGRGKHSFEVRNTWEAWQNDPQSLIDYNIEDAVLMRDIEQKTGYLDLHYTVCEVCTTLPDSRGINPTNYVEGFMLKLGAEHDQHFATKWNNQEEFGQFAGAYVMEPTKTGLLKGVHVCDFASLYPSVIISWNLSPETLTDITLVEDEQTRPSYLKHLPRKEHPIPPGHCAVPITNKVFRNNVQGLLPLALEQLLALRNVWKKKKAALPPGTPEWKEADRRAGAYKIAANSFYGVQGSPFSRFHVRDVAESVSQGGKWLILETLKAAEERGFETVYSDTDSLFIEGGTNEQFQAFVDWCNAELYPALLKSQGCVRNTIKLGYEKKFDRLVMIRKKRYAGRYEHYEGTAATADSKPEIKGLEYKRGDTLRLARELQYEVVRMLLYDEIEDVETYRALLLKWRTRILEEPLKLEDVRMSNSLGKHPEHYQRKRKKDGTLSALPPHVEVALKLLEQGADVAESVRIEYVVKDGRSPMQAIPATEYDGTNADRYYIWEALLYPPTQRVLEAVFKGHKWKDFLRVRPTGKGRGVDSLGQGQLF